jgi:hypothetical protein
MLKRAGQYVFWLGIFVVLLFVVSDAVHTPEYELLLYGVIAVFVGVYLWRQGRTPAAPSERFRTLRRITSRTRRTRKKDEEKPEDQSPAA